MPLPIHVSAYSGYRANERPQGFTLDEESYEIERIEDRRYEPEGEFFKVATTEAKRFVLRYDRQVGEWTLGAG